MRWLVEVTPLRASLAPGETVIPAESYVLEAKTWQAALQQARDLSGSTGPISQFSIELLPEGYRAIDPIARLRYVVKRASDDAPLTSTQPAPPTTQPASSGPPTVPTSTADPPRPGRASATAPAPSRPPAIPADPIPKPSPVAESVAQPAISPAPRPPSAAPANPASVPNAPVAPMLQQTQKSASVVEQIPPFETLLSRIENPSEKSPISYREHAYFVPPGTPEKGVERLLRVCFLQVLGELRDAPPGKMVNLAVFDVVFAGKPPKPPIATLAWKDWRGAEPEIRFPARERATQAAVAAPRSAASVASPASMSNPAAPPPVAPAPAPTPAAAPAAVAPAPVAARVPASPAVVAPVPASPVAAAPVSVAAVAPVIDSAQPSFPAPAKSPPAAPRPASVPPPAPARLPSVAPPPPPPPVAAGLAPTVPASADGVIPVDAGPSATQPAALSTTQPAIAPSPPTNGATREPVVDIMEIEPDPTTTAPPVEVIDSAPPPPAPVVAPTPPAAAAGDATAPSLGAKKPAPFAPPPAAAKPARRRLSGDELLSDLFEAMHDVHFANSPLEAAQFVLSLAQEKLPVTAALCHFFDIDKREFVVAHALAPARDTLLLSRTPERDTLAMQTMRRRRAIVINDPMDARIHGGRFDKLGEPVRSVVIAPVALGGRFLGMLELINPSDGGPFEESDGYALSYMAEQFAEYLGQRGVTIDEATIRAFRPR